MLRTLIIDDEPGARAELRWLLSEHPNTSVVGEAATFNQGIQVLQHPGYDLVLLDIQLIGGTGFDLVPYVLPGARIIFVTAYDQHALRAFEVNALDYLLKPVATDRFATALARLASAATPPAADSVPSTSGPARLDDQILVKLDSATERFVRLSSITCISASENYTDVLLTTGEKLFVRRTMKAWEDLLPAEHFGRVHRTVIVAFARIERIVKLNRTGFEVVLDGVPTPFPVSYRLVADLRNQLGARWPEG